MTRDEAIAYLIDRADELEQRRAAMIPRARWRQECAEFAEAKAALAEPEGPNDRDIAYSLGLAVGRDQGVRCQHQAADATLDCTEPAVLCETHGGHDACAVEIMRLQGDIAEHVNDYQIGAQDARDEIARALEAQVSKPHDPLIDEMWLEGREYALTVAAAAILDGSIKEWLPKEKST